MLARVIVMYRYAVLPAVQVLLLGLLIACVAAPARASDDATSAAPAHASDVAAGAVTARTPASGGGEDIVTLETGGSQGITVRLAEDLAGIVDDGATRRIVPVVGHGGVDNIADLLQTPGIDTAILQLDVLNYARVHKLFPDLAGEVSYIAKLNYVEFNLLAGPGVNTIADLDGKRVSVGRQLGNTAITAEQLFQLLHLSVVMTNDPPDLALDKLSHGDVSAIAFVGGKPVPFLRMAPSTGLHLVSVPLSPEVAAVYIPTRLTATDYPGLISAEAPVSTIAIPTGLFVGPVTEGSDSYRKISNIVDAFFTQFQTLLAPGHHPKWTEVSLAAEIPGWHRFPAADDWLKRNAAVVAGQDLRAIFMRFLDERQKAVGGSAMSQAQKDALFDQFRQWQMTQTPGPQPVPASQTH